MTSLPTKHPSRALLCPRVSTDDQRDGASIETQEAAMRRRCEERGWSVAGVLADAESGAVLWERPQFKEISRRIQAGQADVVLFYESSRLARDQAYSFIVLELCERHGVRLDFVLNAYDRREDGRLTSKGKLIFGFDSWKAESERDDIIERTSRGKRDHWADGLFMAQGRPPYGYRRHEELGAEPKWSETGERKRRRKRDVRYEADPDTAPVVERIVRLFLAGRTLRAIAKLLTDQGVPTPGQHARITRKGRVLSGIWRPNTVREILLHPAYYGRPAALRWRTETSAKS